MVYKHFLNQKASEESLQVWLSSSKAHRESLAKFNAVLNANRPLFAAGSHGLFEVVLQCSSLSTLLATLGTVMAGSVYLSIERIKAIRKTSINAMKDISDECAAGSEHVKAFQSGLAQFKGSRLMSCESGIVSKFQSFMQDPVQT